MRSLIVTDTHLGLYSDSDIWLDVVLNFFKHIAKYCYKNKIDQIYHLGDFFHNRKALNTKTQHTAHRIAKVLGSIPNLNTTIIVGNHDCYYKNQIQPNTLEMLKKYSHIRIIDEPTRDGDIVLVPWGSNWDITDGKYLFGHFEITGFRMNDSYVCKGGMSRSILKDFDMVLSGHFHTPSQQDNIVYLGAPYGQTFHDAGGKRGFHVFEDGKLDFIIYEDAPMFMKLKTESIDNDIENDVKGNVVRLYFDKDYGTNKNQEIVDRVMSFEPLQFSSVFLGESEEETVSADYKLESKEKIADEFIDTMSFPENINVSTLKTMFKKLRENAERI